MRISDWSSDVCSSDLAILLQQGVEQLSKQRVRRPSKAQVDDPGICVDECGQGLGQGERIAARGALPRRIPARLVDAERRLRRDSHDAQAVVADGSDDPRDFIAVAIAVTARKSIVEGKSVYDRV